jgi:hypothetical protein
VNVWTLGDLENIELVLASDPCNKVFEVACDLTRHISGQKKIIHSYLGKLAHEYQIFSYIKY